MCMYVRYEQDNVTTVHSSLQSHDIIPFTQDGATLLFIASQNGHSDIVNVLIRCGADVHLAWKVLYILMMELYYKLNDTFTSNRDGNLLKLPDLRDTLTLSVCWKEWDISIVCHKNNETML